jgi:hypothetical protein
MNEKHEHEHGRRCPDDCDCPVCAMRRYFGRRVRDCESMRHFRNARIEMLRGVRAFIDERIDHLTKKNEPSEGEREPRVSKVEME